ncbi:MAG TPA: class I SAM-dependent methyltransferase [Bacteroidia bacterium]|nr:class I SAM-dependent methyltransferase [Bacteroidia bacterium]
MLTWEETIIHLRKKTEYASILYDSYLNDAPIENVERFRQSAEFRETLSIIRKSFPSAKFILEIGSGNGVAAAAFALEGYKIIATDPDEGMHTGCEAIRKLKSTFNLSQLEVQQSKGEALPFADNTFDLIYVRQTLHHAEDLDKMLNEISRVLKPGGGFIAVREHVIFNEKDKQVFLASHPLQKWYGGENAFLPEEYKKAIQHSGLVLDKVYKHFDTIINYFPSTENEVDKLEEHLDQALKQELIRKIGALAKLKLFLNTYIKINKFRFGHAKDERRIPGRMYSFIAHK